MITEIDRVHLRRSVDLARTALEGGDKPFGSALVAADNTVLFEDHNRETDGDPTLHPEIAIARWAAAHLTLEQRAGAVVYTSGEHCPMCSAAHAWVGLGRIVYASSSAQLTQWLQELGLPTAPVAPLPIRTVAPGLTVDGPDDVLADEVRELQRRFHRG